MASFNEASAWGTSVVSPSFSDSVFKVAVLPARSVRLAASTNSWKKSFRGQALAILEKRTAM